MNEATYIEDLLGATPGVTCVDIVGESPKVFLIEGDVELVLAVLNTFAEAPQYEQTSSTTVRVWLE
jgi:hypothetical protein